MRFGVVVVLALACACSAGCGSGNLFKQYEYEEDLYLSLDGSATVYVNGSLAALDALRGASFDPSARARFNRDAVRAFFTTPATHVVSVSDSRRNNRRYAHLRLNVADVRRLSQAAPFSWSSYEFTPRNGHYVYRQVVGGSAGKAVPGVNWTGNEIVAFRLHLPSPLLDHRDDVQRGNILVWEQSLADRLRGKPLVLEAQMETESILAHALWLFGSTALAVAAAFALVVWWIARRGASEART